MAFKVLVSDKLSEDGLKVLRSAAEIEVDYRPGLNEQELADAIGEYDGLVIRSGSKVTAKVLASADQLRVIGRAGIGVDNVDVPAASKRGIVVMNTPTGNAVTTAEHAIALLMSTARMIPDANLTTKGGKWEKSKYQGREIAGKTLGVIGLGNIGRIVADRGMGLQMKVIGFDPVLTAERASELGIELVSLDDLFSRADFITIHTPKTAETSNLLNDDTFAKMKDGVFIINAARGGIVDEAALERAVKSKKVAGAALDVFVKEPVDPNHPLLKLDQVVVTPHLGASTHEAQERVAIEISEQVVDYLVRGVVRNAVNVPAITPEVAKKVEPFLAVAKRLGGLLGQLEIKQPREIRVTCTGEAGEHGSKSIARAAIAGFLERMKNEPVNPLSAPYEAQDRGIQTVEVVETAPPGYMATVRIAVYDQSGVHTATGTVGTEGEPRLVGLDGRPVDALLEGDALLMKNSNTPGVIGAVGTILGKFKVNIARMNVRPGPDGAEAIGIWNVDSPLSEEALAEIRKLPQIKSATPVKLG
ncbi:MAG: phosphoglycerate dehydrogenase [Polyangiales bacterium]|nr:phosphoglycerate dehydrogenase [Myxococcales bacterium]